MVCFKKRKREGREEGGEGRRERRRKDFKDSLHKYLVTKVNCFCKSDLEKISLKTTDLLRLILP